MGYESKLVVGEATGQRDRETGARWCYIEAQFDLGKLAWDPAWSTLLGTHKPPQEAEWFYFGDDGNTSVTEDKYGELLRPLPLEETLAALEACESPRAKAAAAWLRAWDWTDRRVVLHFGY